MIEDGLQCHIDNTIKFIKTLDRLDSHRKGNDIGTADPSTEMTKINLKDRIVRLNMEKLMVIISENSISEETISNLADEFLQDSASSNLMKESTKYDLGASDKTSIISSTLGQSKAQPEEMIDLICLEMNNLTCRVDLCPEETELPEEIAQDINKKLGIPTVKGKI